MIPQIPSKAVLKSSLFKDLSENHLDQLVSWANTEHFLPDQWIFHQGEPALKFYLIKFGKVSLSLQSGPQHLTIQTLSTHSPLGWSWFFPPFQWQFDAKALVPTECLVWDAQALKKSCDQDPTFGYAFLKHISEVLMSRLQSTRLQMVNLYGAQKVASSF